MPLPVAAIIEKLSARVAARGFSAGTVKILIPGEPPLVVAGQTVSATDGRADCTVMVDAGLLDQFLDGEADPHWALIEGNVSYTGDFAVARAFGGLLT